MSKTTEFVPMSLESAHGSKVKYLGVNGYDNQRKHADKLLTIGAEYTVERVEIADWCSTVELAEFPGHFNTVMFQNV